MKNYEKIKFYSIINYHDHAAMHYDFKGSYRESLYGYYSVDCPVYSEDFASMPSSQNKESNKIKPGDFVSTADPAVLCKLKLRSISESTFYRSKLGLVISKKEVAKDEFVFDIYTKGNEYVSNIYNVSKIDIETYIHEGQNE